MEGTPRCFEVGCYWGYFTLESTGVEPGEYPEAEPPSNLKSYHRTVYGFKRSQ